MSEESRRPRDWWMIPTLWLGGGLIYLSLLGNRFIGDDYTALSIFRHYRTESFFRTILYGGNDFFRPLNMALVMARGAVFGDNPLYYVIANILMHLANTTMVFLLARRLFKNSLATFAAAALFLVAFSHYEAITWISGSITLFVTFFALLTLYSHMRYREGAGGAWLGLSIAGFVLAFLTQEAAIALALLLPLYDLVIAKREERGKSFWYPYIIYGILLTAYVALQFGWAYRFVGGESPYRAGWHVLTNIPDYWVWLWMPNPRHPYVAGVLGVLPRPLLIFYWVLAAGVTLTLPLIIVLAALRKLSRPQLYSFLAALAALVVYLPFAIKISARYPYLPSVGISLFAAGVFAGAWGWMKERSKKAWQWVLGIVAGLYLATNALGLVLIQREFVRVSTLTERLAHEVGERIDLMDEDVVFIEDLPAHVHLREAVHWFWNPEVEVLASNDAYRDTPKTLEGTRQSFACRGGTLYCMRFTDGRLVLVSSERL